MTQVARWKTAIVRQGLSSPVAAMSRLGIIDGTTSVFDYGCGHGRDVEILLENGIDAFGWDPAHRPDGRRDKADIVNLGFVANVIEDPKERADTLRTAWSYAGKALAVAVMLTSKTDVSRHRPHRDGHITSWGTFQKYFSQNELAAWVSDVVGMQAMSIGQGIVAVFRDKALEQETAYRRRSSSAFLVDRLAVTPRASNGDRGRRAVDISDGIEAIWRTALGLGRLPDHQEIPEEVRADILGRRVSLSTALKETAAAYDMAALELIGDARRDDLLVHGALALFPGAPSYASLPMSIQKDIRHFHGGARALADEAKMLLLDMRDPEALERAFRDAAAKGAANMHDGKLRAELVNLERLPVRLRVAVGCADIVHPGFSQNEAVEFDQVPGRLRAFSVRDFDTALPKLDEIVNVDLKTPKAWTSKIEDGVLYLRSTFMADDDEGLERQRAVDAKLRAAGIVDEKGRGPSASKLGNLLRSVRTKA